MSIAAVPTRPFRRCSDSGTIATASRAIRGPVACPGRSYRPGRTRNLGPGPGDDDAFLMNDWSFSQLCRLAEVSNDTVNRVSPATASTVLGETLPEGNKPFQILTHEDRIDPSTA